MRAIWALGMGLLAAIGALAEECAVTVTLGNPALASPAVMAKARTVATGIFAGIGVELLWGAKGPVDPSRCSIPIAVQLDAAAGPGERRGALASATLTPVKHVRVFMDRVSAMVPAADLGILLGHVLAHEITHVLQGVPRHSSAGVMKDVWERKDLQALVYRPLRFALVDEALIHFNLTHSVPAAEGIATNE